MSTIPQEQPVIVRLPGNSSNVYFRLGPIHARQLGLVADVERPYQLLLQEGADPDALLVLPSGHTFTARELTTLAYKTGDPARGWEVYALDGGGYPPTE